MERKEIAPGIFLTYLPARKFKTSLLSAQFVTPLRQETATANALLPAVLRRGTERLSDMQRLSAALDLLYGSRVEYTVRKKGENQCVGFAASMIDDAFAPGGERLLEPVAELMGELICSPFTVDGLFSPAYLEGERENLADAIRSRINDKREYADFRLLQEMCAGEAYGVSRLGDLDSLKTLGGEDLFRHYRELISTARLELFYSGTAEESRVEAAFAAALSKLPGGERQGIAQTVLKAAPESPKRVTEVMDVSQAKLSMGFRCSLEDAPAMQMANAIFGGTSNSKLFLNVREKLSLCYYASAQFHRSKGIVTVSSGIEAKNFQKAYDEILAQLDAVQAGRLEDWEFQGARSSLCNSFRSLGDSQGRLEDFYLGQAATGQSGTPEQRLGEIEAVTLERMRAAASSVCLDSVYFLTGKEEER